MTAAPILETANLILRRPAPRDYPGYRAFMMSDRASGAGGPCPERQVWRDMCGRLGHWTMLGYGMWSVTRNGDDTALGFVGPWTPADWPETEIGWTIWRAENEGTGTAFEAARAAITHAWEVLKLATIVSYMDHDNTRSAALAERLGAAVDPDAAQPRPDEPCLIYRHPRPAAPA